MASGDPIASLIRTRRMALGWSLQRLSDEASRRGPRRRRGGRAAGVSPAYLSLIEHGRRVPDEPVAVAIAAALGEDEALFRAWIAARKRADLAAALDAADTLTRALHGSGAAAIGARGTWADTPLEVPATTPEAGTADEPPAPEHARLRVPVIAEGDDPGDGVRPACPVLEWRALDATALSPEARRRLARPFAIRMAAAGPGLAAGDHALVLRRLADLPPEAVCAVRLAGRVALRRVIWDGRRALVLPPHGSTAFGVVDARDEVALAARVLGVARRVTFPV